MRTWRFWQSVLAQSLIVSAVATALYFAYRIKRTFPELVSVRWLDYYLYACATFILLLTMLTARMFCRNKFLTYYNPQSESDLAKLASNPQYQARQLFVKSPASGVMPAVATKLIDVGYKLVCQNEDIIIVKKKFFLPSLDWRQRIALVCITEVKQTVPLQFAIWLDMAETVKAQMSKKQRVVATHVVVFNSALTEVEILPIAACVVNHIPNKADKALSVELFDVKNSKHYFLAYRAHKSFTNKVWLRHLRRALWG